MTLNENNVKQILGKFLIKFIGIMENATIELKNLQKELDGMGEVKFSAPPSVSDLKRKDKGPFSEMEALSQEIRDDVPKLLSRLKGIMGEEKEKHFDQMSEYERKKALKDMESAIKILSEEYDKCSQLEEEID